MAAVTPGNLPLILAGGTEASGLKEVAVATGEAADFIEGHLEGDAGLGGSRADWTRAMRIRVAAPTGGADRSACFRACAIRSSGMEIV